jgi:tetratricopeptide (TPR) repeat protein
MKASKRAALCVAVAGLLLALGCSSKATNMSTNREEARQRWSASRAEMATKLAQGCYQRGEFGRASEHISELLRQSSPYAPLYVLAGRLAAEKGDLDMARSYADHATELDPNLAEARYVLGTFEQTLGNTDVALAQFGEAARLDPNQPSYILAQTELMVTQGDATQAATVLSEAISRLSGKSELHAALGDVLSVLKRYGEAVGSYRIALRLSNNQQEELRERLAIALYYSGAYAEAATALSELKLTGPDAAAGWAPLMRGECLLALGRLDEAYDIYTAAAAAHPTAPASYIGLAKCDILSNRLPQARKFLEQALTRSPRNAEGNALMGYVLVAEGRSGEAVPHLELALRDPKLSDRAAVEKLLTGVRNGLKTNAPASTR